jgi:hypothetical protein
VVPFTGNTQFDINFDPTSVLGSYTMMIGPDIRDFYGNQMDQDGDSVPGEIPSDQFTTQFALYAVNLIDNGDFEANGGSFDGWTIKNQTGSYGNWHLQTGSASPLNGIPVPEPPGPTHAAMTDSFGPGTMILFQDFTVPMGIKSAILNFDRFIDNLALLFVTPSTLDFTMAPNQQARVDILTTMANPFSVASRDVLLKIFQTAVGDPAVSGYTTQSIDLTTFLAAHEGQTLRLRFAVADNLFNFLFGVDRIILAVNTSQGGAAALGGGRHSNGRLASASAAVVQEAALLLHSSSTEAVLPSPAATLPGPHLASIPIIDRFFGSTVTKNEAHVFTLHRSKQVEPALAGPWQQEALTEIFGKNNYRGGKTMSRDRCFEVLA